MIHDLAEHQTTMNTAPLDWFTANQHYLLAALGVVRAALETQAVVSADGDSPPANANADRQHQAQQALAQAVAAMPAPAALDLVTAVFGLSPFEQAILLLCAGLELDGNFAGLCAAVPANAERAYATFGLALATLPDPHWDALAADEPLRRWRLIDLGPGPTLVSSPLRIAEPILFLLTGGAYVDEQLAALIAPVSSLAQLAASHQTLAGQIAGHWQQNDHPLSPLVQLCGGDAGDRCAIAATAAALLDRHLYRLPLLALPIAPADLRVFQQVWERQALLTHSALLIECDDLTPTPEREYALTWLVERTFGCVLISSAQRRLQTALHQRSLVTLEVAKPLASEQHTLWQAALGSVAPLLNGQVDQLVAQFNLGATAIQQVCARALAEGASGEWRAASDELPTHHPPPATLTQTLWDTCRAQARPRLDDLAQWIPPAATWEDLVLPTAQLATLRDLVIHVRQRARVYEQWGFAHKGGRGLGISALFAGASGTGKTLAAEVLAHALQLDLYRIDLSSIVSKYIGETEKNLSRIFAAAEAGGAILLFDEADALFGKRSEVKDSHDRHANIEVSYLLQRMEAYRGLAILTTNLKSALDTAFLRRIRFIVQFPFPDAAQRAEIWRQIFPPAMPQQGLEPHKLAQLNVAGGHIRNIALHAAFLAADADEPVGMHHLLNAARGEYLKLEKQLTPGEIAGWV